ncbi:hypothetical protein [Fodinicola feengrottensis]|uniref:hypothetical protein n=1 Tax=Fodinicola feengrottensis TaxID=435914 RepID=UPI002440FF05|nr:hypothetical protein [Fodinicola feengrottensis]
MDNEADGFAADIRKACLTLPDPAAESIFAHVYVEETAELARQRQELTTYQASFAD